MSPSRREAAQVESLQQKVQRVQNDRNGTPADREANRLMMRHQRSQQETQELMTLLQTKVLDEEMSLSDFYKLELQVEQARTQRWKACRRTASKLVNMKHYGRILDCFLDRENAKNVQNYRSNYEYNGQYDALLKLEEQIEKVYKQAQRTCGVDVAYRELLSSVGLHNAGSSRSNAGSSRSNAGSSRSNAGSSRSNAGSSRSNAGSSRSTRGQKSGTMQKAAEIFSGAGAFF
jgi:hypothetical protein